MDRRTAKAISWASMAMAQAPRDGKRAWLKLSHRERGKVRTKLEWAKFPAKAGGPREATSPIDFPVLTKAGG